MMIILLVMASFGIEARDYQLLVILPNYLLIVGAVVLWLAFVILGIIARRYEIVLGERTNWQFMMFAPTGILAFAAIQLVYCGIRGNMMLPKGGVNYLAYLLFFISGSLSLLANYRFYKVTKGK